MDKTAIKNYAIWARVQLIEAAKQRAYEYEISEKGENKPNIDTVGGRILTQEEKEQRNQLLDQIRQKGFNQVMEEAAYTWFNRFIALRFMEVNGYLPSKIRLFTDENGAFKPEILKEAMSVELDGLDREKVFELIDAQDNEELYKCLLITQCNALNANLPYMFEKIANWTELLFPPNLLRDDSVLGLLVCEIPEDNWTDAVQIIGWLYQYYNSELKDETFALLKKRVKISKERIPAATQLFTPDWIVRYMVENSLGRLWVEGHPNEKLKSNWKYYLEEAEQEQEVEEELKKIRDEYAEIKPEDIKVIDPAMGSGHILVYAFDLLMKIYTSSGWPERDAAQSILENNLYGLDIDDRAGQLAYFAVMMKARQHSRRILDKNIKPNVLAIQDSSFMTDDFIKFFAGNDSVIESDLLELRTVFEDAKVYGSILDVKKLDFEPLFSRIEEVKNTTASDLFALMHQVTTVEKLLPLIKQAKIMSEKYHVVVTNPPYMGSRGMNVKLAKYIKKNYPDTKLDLFSCFIEKGFKCAKSSGFISMITMESWMFLSSFEKMRESITTTKTIVNMVHMPYLGKGGTSLGINFGTAAVIFKNNKVKNYFAQYNYIRYYETDGDGVPLTFPVINERYKIASLENFSKMPGSPIAYWVSNNFIEVFNKGISINEISDYTGSQNKTANNKLYIRYIWEISCEDIGRHKNWSIYAKGGEFRKWYGNVDLVVKTSDKAITFYKTNPTSNYLDDKYWYQEGITYSAFTSRGTGFRYFPPLGGFDTGGPLICYLKDLNYVLGLLNSVVIEKIISILNPTINLQVKNIKSVPLIFDSSKKNKIETLVDRNIKSSKTDWDSFETSWDFQKHPFIQGTSIEEAFERWQQECDDRFYQLKANEEELNRIFIDIYGLEDELTPEVEEKDVTISKADLQRDIKSLISYAVGCMFGRYSLDTEGLAYAGGEWDSSKYKTFIPDRENIIPICDDYYFDDDMTGRFVNWIETVYGKKTLEENLNFIAEVLGGKGTAREVIRNYFFKHFYKDHLKIYQKLPIYWLFSSGKKDGFKALIYMHRYQPDLLARMRTDYVHEQQERYRTQLNMLEDSLQRATAAERVKLNKKISKFKDQALEIQQYEEKIHHLADQMIPIDLDDGVKVNYAKFKDVLEKKR